MKSIFLFLFLALATLKASANKERWDEIKTDWSPLMLAIYKGQTDEVTKLIEKKVDPNFVTSGKNSNWRLTALEVAIRLNRDNFVKQLLLTNKIINPGKQLLTAAGEQNAVTIELLIKYGANPRDTLENGYAVSMMAASFGSLQVLECLLKNGANVNQVRRVDGITTLMLAAFNGDAEKVKLLLAYGANKYTKDANGSTAFNYVDQIYSNLKVSETTKTTLRELLK